MPPPSPEETTAIRRAAKKMQLPLVSGRASVMVLVLCFALSAGLVLLLGAAMHLPPWIRFELMLLAWWLVWIATLAHFLYHGQRISHDHEFQRPRNWLERVFGRNRKGAAHSAGSWGDLGDVGGADEGCLWVLGIVLAIVAAFILAWLLVEVVIPLLALILYALIRGMLARVANDEHGCTGRFNVALLWGTLWATLFTAPLALMVWVIHLIVAYKAGTLG
jgi:hypothetical protein